MEVVQMEENETQKTEQPAERAVENSNERIQQQTTPVLEAANDAAERIEKASEALRIQNDRTEALQARNILGGRAEAGMNKEEDRPLTDEEFAEKLMLGEVNPLAADGFI